jgi:hypothetical protein
VPHPQPPPGVARGAVALHLPATAPCKFAELSGRRRGRDGWWPWWAGSRRRRPRLSFPLFSWIFPYSCTPPPKTLRYGAPPPWRREKPAGCAPCLAVASSYCGPPPPAGCCCSLQRPASWGPTPLLPLLLSNRSSLAPSLLLLLGRTILDPSYSTSATKRQYF